MAGNYYTDNKKNTTGILHSGERPEEQNSRGGMKNDG
jgi:hypothetical protein